MAERVPASAAIDPLPVVAAGDLTGDRYRTGWLVEALWSEQAVGVIGGAPKSCKTWLALDLAVSVASGTPALGRFAVPRPGPVLLYAAEDAPEHVRDRLDHVARARGLALHGLAVHLILTPQLRLDTPRDRARLRTTLALHRPRLLLLDPLVRLHHADENSAAEMSALLGELRALQRQYALAVLLVHHLRKNAPRSADGQALRGSSDLHAWGDNNLYLRRRDRALRLAVEHRAAPALGPFTLELVADPAVHLRVVAADGEASPDPPDLAERVLALLASTQPLGRDALRERLHTRNATLGDTLARLRAEGRIMRTEGGFRLCHEPHDAIPVPASGAARERNADSSQPSPPPVPTIGPDFDGSA
jgi:hypothetical protein